MNALDLALAVALATQTGTNSSIPVDNFVPGTLTFTSILIDDTTDTIYAGESGFDGFYPLRVVGIVAFDESLRANYMPGATCEDAWDVVYKIALDEYPEENLVAFILTLDRERRLSAMPCEDALQSIAFWASVRFPDTSRGPE